MQYGIYILIILCGILPVIFNRTWWIRTASLIVLGVFIFLYMMTLQTSSRLASIKEYHKTKESPSTEWMDGAIKTRLVIQKTHPEGILLFAALMILAAKPRKEG